MSKTCPLPGGSTAWGTDNLGRDVLAGMVHGARIAMLVGVISMSIALVIGVFFGALAGYFGDNRMKVSRARIILNLLFSTPCFTPSRCVRLPLLMH
ncbi:MAG: hypothetical protein U0T75_14940 [Chitinophagales bacterium]